MDQWSHVALWISCLLLVPAVALAGFALSRMPTPEKPDATARIAQVDYVLDRAVWVLVASCAMLGVALVLRAASLV